MELSIAPASDVTLRELQAWRYPPPYDFFDGDVDPILNPERFFEARDDHGSLVGFYSFETKGAALEIGLGLRPDLVGSGLGLDCRARSVRIRAWRTSSSFPTSAKA